MNIRFHINWNKWLTRISLQLLNLSLEWKRFYRLIEFKILCKRFNFYNLYQDFQVGFSFSWYCEQKLKLMEYFDLYFSWEERRICAQGTHLVSMVTGGWQVIYSSWGWSYSHIVWWQVKNLPEVSPFTQGVVKSENFQEWKLFVLIGCSHKSEIFQKWC